jgi:GcrA cell cycle regulator
MGVTTWTPDLDEQITALWKQGVSAALIGSRIGRTRCSVMGRLWRLSSNVSRPTRVQRRNVGTDSRKERQRRARELAAKSARPLSPLAKIMAEPFVPRFAPITPKHLPLDQLADIGECKYPCSDGPPFSFCGHPAVPGLPYCDPHARICFVPPNPARVTPRNMPNSFVNGDSRLFVADTRTLEVIE